MSPDEEELSAWPSPDRSSLPCRSGSPPAPYFVVEISGSNDFRTSQIFPRREFLQREGAWCSLVQENKEEKMKKTILSILAVSAAAAFAVDETTTSTTTTSTTYGTGTISEYTPGTTFVVKESSGPVTYKYGKKVVYVTKSGKVLTDDQIRTRIKVGAPVRV